MIVMKFGGTSVESAAAIERLVGIVQGKLREKPVVVVSALSKVTDALIEMARLASGGSLPESNKLLLDIRQRHFTVLASLAEDSVHDETQADLQVLLDGLQEVLRGIAALGELSPRTMDNVLSFGEVMSSRIVTAAFRQRGFNSVLVDSRQCIVTDSSHTRALPDFEASNERLRQKVRPLLAKGKLPVMGGFIASTQDGIATTLGRGGSDFSAAIVGAALDAKRIEIWTDVEGMMTTDPRLCSDAQRIDVIGFKEASELAYFGAKVLHPATLIPAIEKDIPVHILNSRNPTSKGTCVKGQAPRSRTAFRAIAAKKGVKVINMRSPRMLMAYGFLRAMFEVFEKHTISADLVSTSEVSVSVVVDSVHDVSSLVTDLKKLGNVDVENGKAIVCLVGENIRGRVGIAASVFGAIAKGKVNIHMISQGASEINISLVVEEKDVPAAVKLLHDRFFPEKRDGAIRKSAKGRSPKIAERNSVILAGVAEAAEVA